MTQVRAALAAVASALFLGFGALAAAAPPGGATLVVGDFSAGLDSGVPPGWQLVKRFGAPDIRAVREGPIAAVAMRSDKSSFGLQKRFDVDLRDYPDLTWRWRADAVPVGGDFRKADSYDMAAQVWVAFSLTRVIGYVWDSRAPSGTRGDAQGLPPLVGGRIIVLRSGTADSGRWLTERRDLASDYRSVFGEEPPPKTAIGIRLHTNSQHTGGTSACAFADVAFIAAPK